ncbi:MAG: RNA pseudouridine synthase [Betaproteobacteria bacterium RIFCSPLOWO2_02_FULL_67_26]|nr:MAG: RNA pseudouridine synthase [Betaproteobacteria bacterium RIFCSPLOWO2_02_FULL_67_26]
MKGLSKDSASWHEVEAEAAGQRVDNYLTKWLKGVPKSHIYRILRSGEVRINSRRVGPDYRMQEGDRLRLPPLRTARRPLATVPPPASRLKADVIHEDDFLLVIDKPAGVAVHGGSGISRGVIEQLRLERPECRFLELVHRLDRDTSGVLLLAKRRAALTALHRQLREGQVQKHYVVLVKGDWRDGKRSVRLPLHKYVLASGERRVSVGRDGMPAHTVFRLQRNWSGYSLLEAELKTGRTHQIRVHLAHLGYPIAGDDKYGDFKLNKQLVREGLKRMFLHACKVVISHPQSGAMLALEAPLPLDLKAFLAALDAGES